MHLFRFRDVYACKQKQNEVNFETSNNVDATLEDSSYVNSKSEDCRPTPVQSEQSTTSETGTPSLKSNKEDLSSTKNCYVVTGDSIPPVPELPASWNDLIKSELSIVSACLEKNPKSYGAWHHRTWVMQQICYGGTEEEQKQSWEKELKLCGLFLTKDERNCELRDAYFGGSIRGL